MNKHPGGGYYGGQPLGPGQAPPVAGQPYDAAYSTWSAAAAAAQQQYYAASAAAAVLPQPAPGINPYANYGYGPAATWAHHHHHHRPPAPIPAIVPQVPGYTPYQPQPQPYGPQGHPQPPTVYPPRPPQPQPSANQHPPVGPRGTQPPPHKRQRVQSTSSNGPPRFPGPPSSSQPSRQSTDPPASLPVTPSTSFNRGGRQGGGMGNNNGGLRGRGHSMRSVRGGRGAGMGNRPMNHGARNASGSTPRGPRRGAFTSSVPARVSRGQFEAPQSHNGWGNGPVGFTPSSSGMTSADKEGKRTLTDFRIVGFGFVSEHTTWSWGTTRLVDDKPVFPSPSPNADGPIAMLPLEEASPVKQEEVDNVHDQTGTSQEKGKKVTKETARIRIYFQPSVGLVPRGVSSANPIMPPPTIPARASAKRKKSESEEDDGDRHNVKRHHGDHDESRSTSLIVEMLDQNPDGTDTSNGQGDGAALDTNSNEQRSDASNEADWLGDALKEEEVEEGEESAYPPTNGQGHNSTELLDELDEEDEEGASLFGSAAHQSPLNGNSDLIVQAVDESVEEENNNLASQPEVLPNESQRATSTPAIGGQSSGAGGPGGAGNKLSISFSTSRRRLVLEVEVIKYLKVFRAEGRIEFSATLESTSSASEADDSRPSIKGVCMDVWDEESQSFQSVVIPSPSNGRDALSDAALPPLYGETNVTFHVFLDLENPLSVPRWVKTGDVDDWLQTIFGAPPALLKGANGKQEDNSDSISTRGWEGKISVMDPDPAPTLQNLLEAWATNSVIAQQKDREQFLKSQLYLPEKQGDEKKEHDMDNILEILLRLIRGDRSLIGAGPDNYHHHHHHYYHHNNSNNSVHPILQAAVGPDPSLIIHQTHSSLAVLAMFRLLQQTALKYGGKDVKREVEDQVRELVKCLPPHMINKSLDGMFQKWMATHGGAATSKAGGTGKGHR